MRWLRRTENEPPAPAPSMSRVCPMCQREIRGYQFIMRPADQPIAPDSQLYASTIEKVVPLCDYHPHFGRSNDAL